MEIVFSGLLRSDRAGLRVMAAVVVLKRRKNEALLRSKKKYDQQRKIDDQLAAAFVDEIDSDRTGVLGRAQVRDLLLKVTGHEQVDEDGLALVVESAQQSSKSMLDENLPREHVLLAVRKYREYLRLKPKVDALFARWDIDLSGGLDPQELKALIVAKEEKKKRSAGGIILQYSLVPSEADIDFIMKECDLNESGTIGKSQLMPALATWNALAEEHTENSKVTCGSCCVIA